MKLSFRIVAEGAIPTGIGHGEGDLVYVITEDRPFIIRLDPEDGYRSYARQLSPEEYDPIRLFVELRGRGDFEEIEYDAIEYNVEEKLGPYARSQGLRTHAAYDTSHWIIRAWKDGKVVFEIGTANCDDYYPNYFVWSERLGDKFMYG